MSDLIDQRIISPGAPRVAYDFTGEMPAVRTEPVSEARAGKGRHRASASIAPAVCAAMGILGLSYGLAVQLTPGATMFPILAATSVLTLVLGGFFLAAAVVTKD